MLHPPPLLTLLTPLMVTGEVTVVRAWEIANPDLQRHESMRSVHQNNLFMYLALFFVFLRIVTAMMT